MKQAGHSLSSIALELNLKSGTEVTHLLEAQFAQDAVYLTSDKRALLLGMEWERLEALIRANYSSAMMGDDKSANIILNAIKLQVQIGQLATPDSSADQHAVLVVGGLEKEYVKKLKELSE